jgi:hypothetical protein
MSSYIEISNGNRITINDSYVNATLAQRITSFSMTSATGAYYQDFSIPSTQLLMIHCSSPNYAFHLGRLPSTTRLTVYLKNGTSISNINSYLTVYVYDTVNGTSGNCGVQVFNSSGSAIFDSSKNYVRMLDNFTYSTTTVDFTYTCSKSYSSKVMATPPQEWGWDHQKLYYYVISFPSETSIYTECIQNGLMPKNSGFRNMVAVNPILIANADNT